MIFEEKYHNRKKMFCASILEDEKRVLDEIINYKKSKNLESDTFEIKKDLLDGEIQRIQLQIVNEVITFEDYKNKISEELNYEKKLLEFAKSDKQLRPEELKIIQERIIKRIELINLELEQQAPIEEAEEQADIPKSEEVKPNVTTENKMEAEIKKNIDENELIVIQTHDVITVKSKKVVEIKDEFLYEALKKRLSEYKLALEYFEKHNLSEQEKISIAKAREIQKAINILEAGNEIQDFDIPESISPDFICGCSKQERFDNYSNIVKEFNKMKNEEVCKRNKIMEKFNQMEKKEQNKCVNF